jgi:hypothetical protein
VSLFSGRNQDPVNKRENASAKADAQPPQDSHSDASTASSERQPSGPSGGPTKRGATLRSKGETVAAIGSTIVFSGEPRCCNSGGTPDRVNESRRVLSSD